MGGVGVSAYLSLILRRRGGRLFEAGRLLTFSAFRMGAYSRWALIRGWALIRINTVVKNTGRTLSNVLICNNCSIPCLQLIITVLSYKENSKGIIFKHKSELLI